LTSNQGGGSRERHLVVGGQQLVPDLEAAHQRIHQHCLPLENERVRVGF